MFLSTYCVFGEGGITWKTESKKRSFIAQSELTRWRLLRFPILQGLFHSCWDMIFFTPLLFPAFHRPAIFNLLLSRCTEKALQLSRPIISFLTIDEAHHTAGGWTCHNVLPKWHVPKFPRHTCRPFMAYQGCILWHVPWKQITSIARRFSSCHSDTTFLGKPYTVPDFPDFTCCHYFPEDYRL